MMGGGVLAKARPPTPAILAMPMDEPLDLSLLDDTDLDNCAGSP